MLRVRFPIHYLCFACDTLWLLRNVFVFSIFVVINGHSSRDFNIKPSIYFYIFTLYT